MPFGQHGERTPQIDVCFLIIMLDKKGYNLFQHDWLGCNQLGDQVYIPIVFRVYIAYVFSADFTVFHTYKRRIIGVDTAEDTSMCLSVSSICISLKRSEMDRQ